MIRVLWLFGLAVAAAALAVLFASQTGYVRISLPGYDIRLSIGVGVLVVVLLVVLLVFGWRVISFVTDIPGAVGRMTRARRERQGFLALTRGMIAAAAGDAPQARLFQRKADVLLGGPPLALLLSAQTAQLDGDEKAVALAYNELLTTPDTVFLGLRGLYLQALRNGARDEALAFAERAFVLKPKTPWVVHALFDLSAAKRNWQAAEAALDAQTRAGVLDAGVVRRRRAIVMAAEARDALFVDDKEIALKRAYDATGLAPGLVPAAVMAARLYLERGRGWKAAGVIEAAWAQSPHPELAEVYSIIKPDASPEARLTRLESLMLLNPDHPESRLLKAATRLARNDINAARAALTPLFDPVPTVRVSAMMADICEAEGDVVAARSWRERALHAPADGFWACASCGHATSAWDANCPSCNNFDTLTWRAPQAERLHRLEAPISTTGATAGPTTGATAGDAAAEKTRARGQPAERIPMSRLLYRLDGGGANANASAKPRAQADTTQRSRNEMAPVVRIAPARPAASPSATSPSGPGMAPPDDALLARLPDDPGPGGDDFGEPEPPKNPLTNPNINRRS